jgi:hypothetical protein
MPSGPQSVHSIFDVEGGEEENKFDREGAADRGRPLARHREDDAAVCSQVPHALREPTTSMLTRCLVLLLAITELKSASYSP